MNNTNLIGRLTRDPELRYTPSGVAVTQFTLAVQRDFKNEAGEYEADFIPVVTWRKTAEFAANYFKKGKLVSISSGRIQTRNYENNEGRTIYVTEVISDSVQLLEWDKKTETPDDPKKGKGKGKGKDPFAGDGKPIDISDDDLPF